MIHNIIIRVGTSAEVVANCVKVSAVHMLCSCIAGWPGWVGG